MVVISTAADDAGHPLATDAGIAHQPARYHASLFGHPAAASYVAGTSPSSLPPFPASASPLPLHQHHQWQQLQPTPQPFPSFLDNSELKSRCDDDLSAMVASFLPPRPAPAQPQPWLWMPSPMQGHPSNAMAAPVLAVVPADVDANTQTEEAAAPAPRRRGRPRKITAGAPTPAAARTKKAAPRRRTASVTNSTSTSSGNQVQHPEQPAIAVAVAALDHQTAPWTNPTAPLPDQEQLQLRSTSTNSPRTGEEEAAIMEQIAVSCADISAPGVRFQPTDEELIAYLKMKYHGSSKMPVDFIRDFDVYLAHPETVKDTCGESVDGFWYVFSPRSRRYENGTRPARSVGVTVEAAVGFWKSNTKETDIRVGGKAGGAVVGRVTALTFQLGRQPKGIQTPWKMKEYCIPEKHHEPDGSSMLLDDWVVCKLFFKEKKYKSKRKNKDKSIVPLQQEDQSGEADEDADETKGDEDVQIVVDDQTLSNSEQELCVEDYLVCDPTCTEQNHAAN